MRCQSALMCLLGGSLLVPTAHAVTDARENVYDSIAEKNAFRLKPPTPLPPPDSLKDPPSKVTLTGITDIFGDKLALLEAQTPNKPKVYLTLSEGQREGDIEVVSINQKVGTVTIKNQDVTQTLDFGEANKRTSSVAPPVAVNVPVNQSIPSPQPGVAPQNNEPNNPGGSSRRMIPTRNMRTSSSGDGTSGVVTSGDGTVTRQNKPMTAEEQIARMKVYNEVNAEDIARRKLPPLPRTPE